MYVCWLVLVSTIFYSDKVTRWRSFNLLTLTWEDLTTRHLCDPDIYMVTRRAMRGHCVVWPDTMQPSPDGWKLVKWINQTTITADTITAKQENSQGGQDTKFQAQDTELRCQHHISAAKPTLPNRANSKADRWKTGLNYICIAWHTGELMPPELCISLGTVCQQISCTELIRKC